MCEDEFFLRRRRFYLIFFRGIVYFLPRMKPGNRKREKRKTAPAIRFFLLVGWSGLLLFQPIDFLKKIDRQLLGFLWTRSVGFVGARGFSVVENTRIQFWLVDPQPANGVACGCVFFFNLLVPKANWVVPFCLLLLLVLLRFKGFVGFNPYRNELESGFLEFNSEFYGIVLGLTGFDRV